MTNHAAAANTTMITYRAFQNSDPPKLVRLWSSQPDSRAVIQPINASLLELFVFSKPYFDPQGLIIAEERGEPVGFVHAGFGPDATRSAVSTDVGVICMLVVADRPDRDAIADALVSQGEAYLLGRGAQELRGGAVFPLAPFYLGLYGGSELPGVFAQDETLRRLYQRNGYREVGRTIMLGREVKAFRPPLDARHLAMRRDYRITAEVNPPELPWWDVCAYGPSDRIRYQAAARNTPDRPVAEISFWDMGPMAQRHGRAAMGVLGWEDRPEVADAGLNRFLLGEALRHLGESGVTHVEAQTCESDQARRQLFEEFGFLLQGEGCTYGKAND